MKKVVLLSGGIDSTTCLAQAVQVCGAENVTALCVFYGQKHSRDATTFLQRFTPRRRASIWSVRNVGLVADLIEQGRMRERGHAEIDRAKADGRWERAYEGQARADRQVADSRLLSIEG